MTLAGAELDAYFAGTLRAFTVPVGLHRATPFDHRVLTAVAEIGYGATTTYAALAATLGLPRAAARQVGAALARNPVLIVVPCHRVLGADGALVGYAGGVATKRRLLDVESVEHAPRLMFSLEGLPRDARQDGRVELPMPAAHRSSTTNQPSTTEAGTPARAAYDRLPARRNLRPVGEAVVTTLIRRRQTQANHFAEVVADAGGIEATLALRVDPTDYRRPSRSDKTCSIPGSGRASTLTSTKRRSPSSTNC